MFPPTFSVPACSAVGFSATVEILIQYLGEAGGALTWYSTGIPRKTGPNCSMTHCPGKIEYNCRYFLMTFRKWISKSKFSKTDFHTLQGIMSHRPLTNTSSLKITAAYWPRRQDGGFGEGGIRDGKIGKGQIREGGCEETFHCLILTKEKHRFTEPSAVALLNYISSGILWQIFAKLWHFAGFSLYISNLAVGISEAAMGREYYMF